MVVYRFQQSLYIFDPPFNIDLAPGYCLTDLSSLNNVRRLLREMDAKHRRIDTIMIKGIGDADADAQYLRLCARWLEELLLGEIQIEAQTCYSITR